MDTQGIWSAGALHNGLIFNSPQPPEASPPARTIVIVGAGFSGTAVAINLLRLPHAGSRRVVLIERAEIARGVAYTRRETPYLLNVPAGRMSLSTQDPLQFVSYARRSLPRTTAEDFLPRELYGQYLETSLLRAAQAALPDVRLERVHGEVIAVEKPHRTTHLRVHLQTGGTVTADALVLAPGNPPPAPLPGAHGLPRSRYAADPWQMPATFRGESLLVVGTGLTMADIVLGGTEAAEGRTTIHALSRHGLIPACQTEFHPLEDERLGRALTRGASLSVRRLMREVRALAEDLELRGGDWREAITVVRDVAPQLWQRLETRERQRFLRHVRAYWEVHRHRLPRETWSALDELRRSGTLQIHAGRLLDMQQAGRKVRVTWRARGVSAATTLLVDRVVNCTGPQYDVRSGRERLLRSLIAAGLAVPDELGLGITTDEYGALIDASGRPTRNLFYIGPMLRPRFWETTAVQELRVHAERLARHAAAAAEPAGATHAARSGGRSARSCNRF
jgi:uncharacterized NAD(P)/FAD-binding protein YdhS